MISRTKRRLACGIGAGLAAAAAFGTLGINAASASSDLTPSAGITVPGDATRTWWPRQGTARLGSGRPARVR
jgi:hypothetical protein